jgi:hypothetical protein
LRSDKPPFSLSRPWLARRNRSTVVAITSADEAFRAESEGGCALVK